MTHLVFAMLQSIVWYEPNSMCACSIHAPCAGLSCVTIVCSSDYWLLNAMTYSLDASLKSDDRFERTSCHYEDRVYSISDHAYPEFNVSQSGPNFGLQESPAAESLPNFPPNIDYRT